MKEIIAMLLIIVWVVVMSLEGGQRVKRAVDCMEKTMDSEFCLKQ
jgi:hypothetical protein